ncbi:MAG: gliding motility lipoprotein GldH [Raineya sp.]
MSFVLFTLFFASACQDTKVIFEDNKSIKNGLWQREEPISFEFEIQDTSKRYDLYYNIRNELSYPHYNLYVTYYLHYPDGKKIDSLLMDILLFDKNTGNPFGEGTGGIRTHQLPAFPEFKFTQKGKYKYTFKQYMRLNPLKGILSVGLRIEETDKSEHQDTPKTAK